MAASILASEEGLKIIEKARVEKGWTKKSSAWCNEAKISSSTLDRFWRRIAISQENFVAICRAVGFESWQDIADLPSIESYTSPPSFFNYDEQTWVGREERVEELSQKLQGKTRLLWITGISGVGKTTLGECLASKAWRRNPSFQWVYLEVLEEQSPEFVTVAADLLVKLGVQDLDPQERNDSKRLTERLIHKLQANYYWIQVDSLERLLNPEQPIETEFTDSQWITFLKRCLIEQTFASRLILTAQALPVALSEWCGRYANVWHTITLQGLSCCEQNGEQINEHLKLFKKNGVTIDAISSDHLMRIGQIYEGHPLVLQVIAKEILASPFNGNVEKYWQRYGNEFEQVARELQAEQIHPAFHNQALQKQVHRRVTSSLKSLPLDALNLLYRSSVYRRPVPATFWLEMVANYSSQRQGEAYQFLEDRALVEKEDVYYQDCFIIRQHNLIRHVAYNELRTNSSVWREAEAKAAEIWLTKYETTSAINTGKIEIVRGHLEAFHHYCQIEDWKAASDLFMLSLRSPEKTQLYWLLMTWGYYREQLKLCERLVNRVPLNIELICHNGIGLAKNYLGDYQGAIEAYQKSLNIAIEVDDKYREGAALNNLGLAYSDLQNHLKAIEYYEQSLQVAREVGNQGGVGSCLCNLGRSYNSIGNYQSAIDCLQTALDISRNINEQLGEVAVLNNLGDAYWGLKKYQEAITHLQDALKVACIAGDRQGEGEALSALGGIQTSLGRYTLAHQNLQSSLKIFQGIGALAEEAEVCWRIASLNYLIGHLDTAEEYFNALLKIKTELEIPLTKEQQHFRDKLALSAQQIEDNSNHTEQ